MSKYFISLLLVLAVVTVGCDRVKSDIEASANSLKTDFENTKSEVEAGVEGTKQFFNDVKTAAQEVQEAKEALENIGN